MKEHSKQVDTKLAELYEKDKEWQQREKKLFELTEHWQSKRHEWERNQMKRQEIMEGYEKIVEDQHRQLRNYTLGLSSFLNSVKDEEMIKEINRAMSMTEAADDDLQYGRESKTYLDGLTGHLGNLEDQQTYLKSYRKELLKRKKDIEQNLEKLNELKAISDECNRDIEECGKALAKCDEGLEECKARIQNVKKRLEEVQKEREKMVEEIGNCEVRLRSSTKDLVDCQDRVKDCIDKLETRSKELDTSIVSAATGAGAALGGGAGAIGAVVLSGGILLPLLIGASVGAAVGRSKGNDIKRDNEEKRRRLKECQRDLERCDDVIECLHKIVNECREEIEHMKKIIASAHHHSK